MLRAVFAYQNLDSTADLNLRFESLFTKGVFLGGDIVANGTNNTVSITAFRAVTRDGMIALNDVATDIVVPGNQKSYLCLRAKYNAPSPPELAWVTHTLASYNAASDKDFLIVFGTVDLAASAGPVFANLVSYADRNVVTPVSRNSFLGTFVDLPALQAAYPATVPTKQKSGDIALAISGLSGLPTWYRWDATGGSFSPFGSYNTEISNLNSHIADDDIHVTPTQKAALAGTSGTPSGSNRFITENDTTRVVTAAERQAIANAVGLDSGLSDTNPLVADKTAVVSQMLVSFVGDGGNVVAINSASFGGADAVVYIGRQGIDGNGRSSACQYFAVEDNFGDGLAPVITGVETPIVIQNVSWNAVSGSTLNPASNPQVDQNGYLTISPGQTLYLNLNANIPLGTNFLTRLNVKGRVRDLVPNWNTPVSYPARTAPTAFRSGRQPYVIANTGDFKTLRIGDPTKGNVFISADQAGYPGSGFVDVTFYSGTQSTLNRRSAMRVGISPINSNYFGIGSSTFDVSSDPAFASVTSIRMRVSDRIYSTVDLVIGDNQGSFGPDASPTSVMLKTTGQVLGKGIVGTILGANPTHAFMENENVGLGYIDSFTMTDPGGSATYRYITHLTGGNSSSGHQRRADVLLLADPGSSSVTDTEVNSQSNFFAIHRDTNESANSVTYTLWSRSPYGSSIRNFLSLSASQNKYPNGTLTIGPQNSFELSNVDANGVATKITNGLTVSSGVFHVTSSALFQSTISSYIGLNSTSNPSYRMRQNPGTGLVDAASLTPYNAGLIRLNSGETRYGIALFASDTSGLKATFIGGVTDAVLLPTASNSGSVRLGNYGFQLAWNKNDPSDPLSSQIVIEESNSSSRELLIGRRLATGGLFQYATAIRMKEGVITLPFISEVADMINLGGSGAISVSNEGVNISYGGTYFTVTDSGASVGQVPASGGISRLSLSGYGSISMVADTFTLSVGANVNDRLLYTGTTGAMALVPNVTNVTDIGSLTKSFNVVHARGAIFEHFTISSGVLVRRIVPNVDNVSSLGTNLLRFGDIHSGGTVHAGAGLITGAFEISTANNNIVPTSTGNLGSDVHRFNNVYARHLRSWTRYSETVTQHIVGESFGSSHPFTGAPDACTYIFNVYAASPIVFVTAYDPITGLELGTSSATEHKIFAQLPDASLQVGREITIVIRCMSLVGLANAMSIKTSLSTTANIKKTQYVKLDTWTSTTLKFKAVNMNVWTIDSSPANQAAGNPQTVSDFSWVLLSVTKQDIYS